jgi:hypothetical protein
MKAELKTLAEKMMTCSPQMATGITYGEAIASG